MTRADPPDARNARARATEDEELADAFAARAADVRSQVTFLLSGGLSTGATEALGALAEQDMVDFCILVDLANGVALDGVAPLDAETQRHLSEFLDEDPWRSLAIDNDITVVLAMIEDVLSQSSDAPWYRVSPQLPTALADLMGRVNREQYGHFAGELKAHLDQHAPLVVDGIGMVLEIVRDGARRVGAHPLEFNR